MRLDFNILWVEDQEANVQSQQTNIENRLRKEGFNLCVQFAPTVDDARRFLSQDIYGDHVDLILMDYNLGTGVQGDEGLLVVRDIFPYKDIIFYSGVAPADLKRMVANQGVQGVFVSDRESLPDEVEGVFRNLVHKVLDIDHSRGIVMGATSDIDQSVNRAMNALFDGCDEHQRELTIGEFKKHLADKRKRFDKAILKLDAVTHVSDLESHHRDYTSDDRLRLLRKILKITNRHTEHLDEFERYKTTVTPQRNDLAHISVQKVGFSRKVFYRNGEEITMDDMRKLRISLLDFQDLLVKLFGPPVTSEADE